MLTLKKHRMKRLVVGWVALYPTLLIILYLLGGITHRLSMPLATLVEVIVIVPVTQWIVYPAAERLFQNGYLTKYVAYAAIQVHT